MAKKDRSSPSHSEKSATASHYTVLARRWRPQQFDDLVGQEAIGQALKGAITSGRVAHAYLFTGARGVGKTSSARILAKALNCKDGPTCTPCGKCDACESIAFGDDVDVLEIDGASNRGIDEVRELRQNVNLRPTRCRYKIYIIDEVHMLTRDAFNALLKTLEEPPQHVKFIFATTDPQKIPITVLSRCQRFDFGAISSERIQKRLEEIVRSEGIAVDEEVLELLSRRAAGSMRDSLSLLDQLLAFGGEQVTADQLHRLLGTASEDRLLELATSLLTHNAGAATQVVDQGESEGVQLGELLDQLIGYFRDLMIIKAAGPDARLSSVSSRQRSRVSEQAATASLDFLLATADILAETKNRLRGSTYGRVLVDVALVRIANLEDLASLGDLRDQLTALESRLGGREIGPRAGAVAPPSARALPAAELKKNYPPGEADRSGVAGIPHPGHKPDAQARDAQARAAQAGAVQARAALDVPLASPSDLCASVDGTGAAAAVGVQALACSEESSLKAGLQQHVGAQVEIPRPLTAEAATQLVRDLSQDLGPVLKASIMRAGVAVNPGSDTLVVNLDPMYNGAGLIQEIEAALQQRLGAAMRIRVQVSDPKATPPKEQPARRPSYSERLSEANRDTLVRQAIDVLGARVTRVDES
ncbi:MAG: DNA polymerase III subunit gamma/tau [Planctomycetes bacterium]|nr:DNA polymerase III subunit gamma/tau [Planctomycetota bacterium]